MDITHCPGCGDRLDHGKPYCASCGARVAGGADKRHTAVVALVAGAVVLIGFGLVAFSRHQSARSLAREAESAAAHERERAQRRQAQAAREDAAPATPVDREGARKRLETADADRLVDALAEHLDAETLARLLRALR